MADNQLLTNLFAAGKHNKSFLSKNYRLFFLQAPAYSEPAHSSLSQVYEHMLVIKLYSSPTEISAVFATVGTDFKSQLIGL